jgi:transcriptional regulator NrdR family protein
MKEVKVRFAPEDLAVLDQQAAAAGVSRAELIRNRALVANCDKRLTTAAHHELASDALTSPHGSHQHLSQAKARDQPVA